MTDLVASLHVGDRVVVRVRLDSPDVPTGAHLTDVVGDLLGVSAAALTIGTRHGEQTVRRDQIVAAKAVPPRAARRAAAHLALDVVGLQTVIADSWGAIDRDWLGRWLLRASGGYTARANSVALLGDPGRPVQEALDDAAGWYAARGLPLAVMVAGEVGFDPIDHPVGAALARRDGSTISERTVTMTAPVASLRGSAAPAAEPSLPVHVSGDLADDWLEAHLRYRTTSHTASSGVGIDRAVARAVLTGSACRFLTVRDDDGAVIALARAGLSPDWVGLASVWVEPEHRGRGLGAALTQATARVAQEAGARAVHLQVLRTNAPALALYRRLGFVEHHEYVTVTGPGVSA